MSDRLAQSVEIPCIPCIPCKMVLRYRLSRKVADVYLAWSNSLSGHVFLPCAYALLLGSAVQFTGLANAV